MTHISEFVAEVRAAAANWPGCSHEQALLYACEEVATRECPLPALTRDGTAGLVARICLAEDIDVPHLHFGRRAVRCVGWAHTDSHTLGFNGAGITAHSVVHEIAHLTSRSGLHDSAFRNELVGLARRYVGIEYAALLHSLFRGVGLDTPAWTV